MTKQRSAVIAIYSLKGGVGKTSFAVNLAWEAAVHSLRRTLLWDLDPQAAASWLIGADAKTRGGAQAVFAKDVDPTRLIRATGISGLDLLAADASLRGLDRMLFTLGKRKRLARLIEGLREYDRILLDCPPGLAETAEQAMRAADLIIVPVIPSPLSQRAMGEVMTHLDREHKGHGPVLPVFSMVDRRRALHKAALDAEPSWPAIPMASAVEQMGIHRAPIGTFAGTTAAGQAFASLWRGIEKKLAARR